MTQTRNGNGGTQMALLSFEQLNADVASVFGMKEVKNAKGIVVGKAIGIRPIKELKAEFGLTKKEDRETLNDRVLEITDAALRAAKGEIASLGPDWTLTRAVRRMNANGRETMSIGLARVNRKTAIRDAQTADQLNRMGMAHPSGRPWSGDMVREVRERQEAAQAGETLEMEVEQKPVETSVE